MNRVNFIILLVVALVLVQAGKAIGIDKIKRTETSKVKIGLNCYSFNQPLMAKTMTVEEMFRISASIGFEAADLTGYYFSTYPAVPSDEEIYRYKKCAFQLGLDISGTGVRNDFTLADPEKRKLEVQLIKDWIIVAAKLGAPVIRVFAGKGIPEGFTRKQVVEWMGKDLQECADFGEKHGVMVGIQNHNDFLKTADDVEEILQQVKSDWFGLILDIGSFRTTNNPYKEIEQVVPYAINWQIKETVFINNVETKTDLKKIAAILKNSGYRGYIPIETLGAGDPKEKVTRFYGEVKEAVR
ncbi:MAG: sugar phosphate isomerase/epimerase [Mariniphaga sp.]|nr:sugar phosphate isomerase/epimerase [Mariniphaga sp.]